MRGLIERFLVRPCRRGRCGLVVRQMRQHRQARDGIMIFVASRGAQR